MNLASTTREGLIVRSLASFRDPSLRRGDDAIFHSQVSFPAFLSVALFLCHPERSRGTRDLSRSQPTHSQPRINRDFVKLDLHSAALCHSELSEESRFHFLLGKRLLAAGASLHCGLRFFRGWQIRLI